MAVLPPDPLFRFKSDLGHLHALCFLESSQKNLENRGSEATKDTIEENFERLEISTGKQLLLAAGEAGIVYFFDLENNRLQYKQEMGISIQAVHTYRNEVIVQEKAGNIFIYRQVAPSTGESDAYEKLERISCASGFCKSVQAPNQPEVLLVPQENATVDVYSLLAKAATQRLAFQGCGELPACLHDPITPAQLGQMMCLEVGQLGKDVDVVFAGFETGDVLLWSRATGKLLSHATFNECITAMTYDSVSARGVVGGAGSALQVFGVDKAAFTMRPLAEISLTNPGCQAVRVRPDRKVLVAGGFDGRTRIYSWKTLRLLAALTENHACVTDVRFTREVVPTWRSQIMAVGGADGVITLWNLYK